MSDDSVKEEALKQAQQANWFDDGTGSRFMPDEIVDDQYDPKGLNKKKGI